MFVHIKIFPLIPRVVCVGIVCCPNYKPPHSLSDSLYKLLLPCYPNETLSSYYFEEPQISVVLLREPMLCILPTWQCPLCDSLICWQLCSCLCTIRRHLILTHAEYHKQGRSPTKCTSPLSPFDLSSIRWPWGTHLVGSRLWVILQLHELSLVQLRLPQFIWAYLSSSVPTSVQLRLPQFIWAYLSSSVPTSVQLRLPQFICAYVSSTEATSVHLSLSQFICAYVSSTAPTSVHLSLSQFICAYVSSTEATSVHLSLPQFICAYVSSTEATSVHLSLYLSSSVPTSVQLRLPQFIWAYISVHLPIRQFNWGYIPQFIWAYLSSSVSEPIAEPTSVQLR